MQVRQQVSRRTAIAAAAGMVATAISGSPAADGIGADFEEAPWIDAHSHIWTNDLSRFKLRDGATIEQLQPPSFTDDELMAVAGPEGVGRVVLIQHYPHHGWDNSYLLDAVQRHPKRFRIVGMIDDSAGDPTPRMRQLLKQGVTGFRIGPGTSKGSTHWLLSDGLHQMWKAAAETRQSMCCLINPADLAPVFAMCGRYPDTPVVIDHFARIGVSGEIKPAELKQLLSLSRHPHVRVKISAYYALGKKQPPHHELVPMIRQLFDAFGPDRLMWASDCPYQLDAGNDYRSSIALIRDHIDFVTPEERRKLLQTTAATTFFFA